MNKHAVDVLLLTPVEVEYQHVRTYLEASEHVDVDFTAYEIGKFKGKYHDYTIGLRLTGSKNADIALATERAIQHLHPAIAIVLGICGGVKDVTIGDIVVGTKAYGYESGKETAEEFVARPEVYQYDRDLIEFARVIARTTEWQSGISSTNPPSIHFGAIASGNKVIASTNSPIYKQIKKHFNDTLVLEMESTGFAAAVAPYRHIRAMNIRGVSDTLDNKAAADKGGSQERAVQHAAAFTFHFLHELDFLKYKLIVMDAKQLSEQLTPNLIPILKAEAANTTSPILNTNTALAKIWTLLQPKLVDELEELRDDPEDEELLQETMNATKTTLRRVLKKNATLKAQIEELLATAKAKDEQVGVRIENSSNVVQGSTINAGGNINIGDQTTNNNYSSPTNQGNVGVQINNSGTISGSVHVGDVINYHISRPTPTQLAAVTDGEVGEVKNLISRGKVAPAIDRMLGITKGRDNDTFNEVINVAQRWESIQRENRMGVIGFSEKTMHENRITMSLLSIADNLAKQI